MNFGIAGIYYEVKTVLSFASFEAVDLKERNDITLFEIPVSGRRNFNMVPHVERIGHISVASGKVCSIEKRTELEFCFRLSGGEELVEDYVANRKYCNRMPHLFIKYPGVSYLNHIKQWRDAYYIIYPASTFDTFVSAGLIPENPGCGFTLTPEIKALFEELVFCQNNIHTPGIPDRIDLICLKLISAAVMQNSPQEEDIYRRIVRNIASYIDNNLSSNLDLRHISGEYGMSLRNFFRYWNSVFQETPARYIFRRRMELACTLLQRHDVDISGVAEKSGFSSAGYFIQSFKRYAGVTPAVYRKKFRN